MQLLRTSQVIAVQSCCVADETRHTAGTVPGTIYWYQVHVPVVFPNSTCEPSAPDPPLSPPWEVPRSTPVTPVASKTLILADLVLRVQLRSAGLVRGGGGATLVHRDPRPDRRSP